MTKVDHLLFGCPNLVLYSNEYLIRFTPDIIDFFKHQ